MAMEPSVFVSIISASAGIIIAAASYLFTKKKERDADWRKWKYEQYKEFVAALSGAVGQNSTPESHRIFLNACNPLNLIGSRGVLSSLQSLCESVNADNPREENNARISKLIWEIRKDMHVSGTPKASEFSARLWVPIRRAPEGIEGKSER